MNYMKIFILSLIFIFLFSGLVYAAKYKVNSSGEIINHNVKTTGVLPTQIYSGTTVKFVDIVIDYSGSMTEVIKKLNNTINNVISAIPNYTAIGLRQVGGDFSCKTTRQLAPVRVNNITNLKSGLHEHTYGNEPMVLGVQKAIEEDFAGFDKTTPKKIIMITDGAYTCKEDPCDFARKLMAERDDIHIDIIYVKANGLLFSSYDTKKLSCMANITGGLIHKTEQVNNIPNVLLKSISTISEDVAKKSDEQNQKFEYIK